MINNFIVPPITLHISHTSLYWSIITNAHLILLHEVSFGLQVLLSPASVWLCVRVCVYQSFASPCDYSSPFHLDQKCKTPWFRSLSFGDWLMLIVMSILSLFCLNKLICAIFVLYSVRPSLEILVKSSLATDQIGLIFWPNVSFVVNDGITLRLIIDIAIDLFTSEDRYFLWITALLPCVYNFEMRTCARQSYTRQPTVTQPATRVGSSLLNALPVPSTHYVYNNCIYSQYHLLCLYILNYNRFNHHERPIFHSIGHQQQ